MADPQTGQIGLYLPTRGSDSGVWDLPENANDSATDSLFANVAGISLTNANVTLTTPPNAGSLWSGPYQSQSGILKFTGTLTGNCIITIPRAGFFIVDNQCVVGNFYVQLASAAPGKVICAPPGAPTHVYCDGTDVFYVNLGPVGAALDLGGAVALPAWMTGCSMLPYLVKDGSVFNYSDFPALGRQLGSTFGGNGITTFGVPDERNRMRIPIDLNVGGFSNRITTAGSGIDGRTMNSSGGLQNQSILQTNLPNYNLAYDRTSIGGTTAVQGSGGVIVINALTITSTPISSGGSGTPLVTLPPSIVSFLPLIKT